jgi:RNA polymerase sigma-70 factor (ECF subfamily)
MDGAQAGGNITTKNQDEDSPGRSAREWEDRYQKWSDRLFRYLVHLVGSREAAEDLFQETWMKAMDHQHQLSTEDNFGPWIFRIARNLAFNRMRSGKVRLQLWRNGSSGPGAGEKDQDFIESCPSAAPSPREEAIRGQRRKIVRTAIGRLDSITQEMLQLRYFEELTLAEVGAVLDVPLGTVCTKVHRGLKIIREHLKRQGLRQSDEL